MTPTTLIAPAPGVELTNAERIELAERIIAAIYWSAGLLDKDDAADDAGEPLRAIGSALEDVLGLSVDLSAPGVWPTAEQDATGGELGFAAAIEAHLLPSTVIRDHIDSHQVGLAAVEAAHATQHEDYSDRCMCGHILPDAPGRLLRDEMADHRAAEVRAAILGEEA